MVDSAFLFVGVGGRIRSKLLFAIRIQKSKSAPETLAATANY
jgi:hypothetical protein